MSEVTFNVCDECELKKVGLGAEWLAAHEAALALSAAYPRDDEGNLERLSDKEFEALTQDTTTELQERGGISAKAADFLTRTSELVKANYHCDLRRQLGECAMMPKEIKS